MRVASRLMQRGAVGTRVARVQRMLGLTADGRFGVRTYRAVTTFQRRHHLQIDGVVGPQTRAALRRRHHQRQHRQQQQRQHRQQSVPPRVVAVSAPVSPQHAVAGVGWFHLDMDGWWF